MVQTKQLYEAPEAQALVVRFEGVVCSSPNAFLEGSAGDYSSNIYDTGSY